MAPCKRVPVTSRDCNRGQAFLLAGRVPVTAFLARESRCSLGKAPGSNQPGGKAGPDRELLNKIRLTACDRNGESVNR